MRRRPYASERDVVSVQRHHRRLAVQILQLGEDVEDGHVGVSPREGGIVGNLVLRSNVCIEHPVAHPLYVLVGEEVVFLA